MSKRTVLKVIAGIGVVGVVAAIVHRSNKRVRYANRAIVEAVELVEDAAKTVDEAIGLIEDYHEGNFDDDYFEDEDSAEEDEFEIADSPCGCPYEDRCCIYAERLEDEYKKEAARGKSCDC